MLFGCDKSKTESDDTLAPREVSDYTAEAMAWADSVTTSLDTASLVGQLLMPSAFSSADLATLNHVESLVKNDRIGGILWLKGDTLSLNALSDTLGRISPLPLFMAIDAEWGLAMRLADTEEYPKNYRLAHVPEDTLYDYGHRLGKDARRLGLNVIFAPVLDVSPDPSSVMYARSYGNDPETVAEKGLAFARGVADGGALPVAKHFPGLGTTGKDSHTGLPVVSCDRNKLEKTDLLPFARYSELNLGGVMVGHVAVPALDSTMQPATYSQAIISDLLRKRMNFDGIIFSDAMNMHAVDKKEPDEQRYLKALKAGADILLVPTDTKEAIAEIKEAVASGQLTMQEVRDKVRRILFHKYTLKD